ncbi:MAG: hypothetical protein HZB53_17520 [Chloroflexi bacterium]|nr:hypothetical protein [Chloroflexota bacterium]
MKRALALGVCAFGVAFAVLLAQRLSDQSVSLLIGILIGLLAGVPVSALVTWLAVRNRQPTAAPTWRDERQRDDTPRFIVIPPAYGAPASALPPQLPAATYARPPREFTIVGEGDLDETG